ncbi:MAG: phosphoglycolate phosphatase [Limnobacter sp.]|nr:phosphoglycolate phosphatase [Limnobacter sp.]
MNLISGVNPQTLKAIFFDLDGTLLHTVPDLAAAVNAMLKDLGRNPLSEEVVATYVGKGADNLINRSLTGQADGIADSELFAQAKTIWEAHYHRINGQFAKLYPGVVEGLDLLASHGIQLGVVTNKPEAFTLPLLERTGLKALFKVIVGGDTCERKKPDAMPLLHACKVLGVEPAQTLMIGDSLNDAQAAAAAGIPCWLLPYGYNEGRDILSTPCDGHIDTIEEAALKLIHSRTISKINQ